jgi:hypothetical protein
MNGFPHGEKGGENRQAISLLGIRDALADLKQSGVMAQIVKEALKEVEWIRKERDEEDQRENERREKAAADAEFRRKREEQARADALDKKRKAEAKANAEADAKRKAAERASAEKKARAEAEARKAREQAERRAAERKQEEIKQKAAQEKADAERQARQKADNERRTAQAAEAERRHKEREVVAAKQAEDSIYDPRIPSLFGTPSHAAAFRKAVLSDSGQRYIPREKQYELAQFILAGVADGFLSAAVITNGVGEQILKASQLQKQTTKEEQERLIRDDHIARVNERWTTVRRAMGAAETAMAELVEDQKKWPYEKALFPIDRDAVDRIRDIGRYFEKLAKALGI